MAAPNILQPSKFVMSLDSLDLSLLPTYQSRLSNNTSSLWSANNRNYNDYFQFEIKPKTEESVSELDDLDDNDDLPSKETTMCYICNLSVPAAYITDHENSLKHQAFVKIADVVLDRARQHMLKRERRCNVEKVHTMYFCQHCVSIVRCTDKQRHEKTKLHKRSLSLDRLLYELVALYTDDDDKSETETDIIDDSNKADESVTTDSKLDDNGNDINSEVDRNLETTVLISDVAASLSKHESENKKHDCKDKIEANESDVRKNITVEDNKVTIEVDDHTIVVPEDNFHGFSRIGKRHVQCKLCKLIFKNEKEHKASKEHLKIIRLDIKDKHCVRNLDDSWSHCIICNEIVENSDVHALCNKTHEDLLQKAIVVNKTPPNKYSILMEEVKTTETQSANTSDSTEYFCSACNLVMHVNNIKSHLKGTKHAINSKSNLHYIMKQIEGSEELLCRACNVNVADDPDEIKKHVNTNEHLYEYKIFIAQNQITQQGDTFYCKLCNVTFTKMNEFCHIEKLSHEVNLAAFNDSLVEVPKDSGSNIDDTVNTECKSAEKSNNYYCLVCNTNVPNNPKNIQAHNDGNRHRKNILNVYVEVENAMVRVASSNTHYQMELTQNEKELKCKVCESVVPNKVDNIEEHIKGLKHRNNVKKIMDDNHIEMKDDRYICNVCKENITIEHEFIHIKYPSHVKLLRNLTQNKEKTVDASNAPKVDGVKVNEDDKADKTDTEKEAPKTPKNVSVNIYALLNHHFAEVDDDPNSLTCRVCSVLIQNTEKDAIAHAHSKNHMEEYKNLMTVNLIFETDTTIFFCGICNCLVPGKGEFHHVFGSRHLDNFIKIATKETCELCDVTDVMVDHIKSVQHETNLKSRQTALNHCKNCNGLIIKNSTNYEQHVTNCETMLKHRMVVRDKICFCILCDQYFARESMLEHAQSNQHLFLFNMMKSLHS